MPALRQGGPPVLVVRQAMMALALAALVGVFVGGLAVLVAVYGWGPFKRVLRALRDHRRDATRAKKRK